MVPRAERSEMTPTCINDKLNPVQRATTLAPKPVALLLSRRIGGAIISYVRPATIRPESYTIPLATGATVDGDPIGM